MKNKSKMISLYVIAAVMIMFYITVLWWGKNPKVGIEYKMYYITHELSDWPGYDKLSYSYGTTEICTKLKDRNGTDNTYKVCQRKGQGWKEEQYEGSVNSGKESFIYYLLDNYEDKASLSVNIKSFAGDKAVDVYANDKKIGQIEASGNYDFMIGELQEKQLLTVKFVSNDCEFNLWSICINME